jgi:hypothetical protein
MLKWFPASDRPGPIASPTSKGKVSVNGSYDIEPMLSPSGVIRPQSVGVPDQRIGDTSE